MLLLLLIILLLSILLLFLLSIKISGLSGDNTGKIILTSIFNNQFQRKKIGFAIKTFLQGILYTVLLTHIHINLINLQTWLMTGLLKLCMRQNGAEKILKG